jgi:hypothetical protein
MNASSSVRRQESIAALKKVLIGDVVSSTICTYFCHTGFDMQWLVRTLVDNGWGRLGMSLRWFFGTRKVLTALVNDTDLKKIEHRHQVLQKTGFFSGSKEVSHGQDFIRALFARSPGKNSAFSKSLSSAYRGESLSTEPFLSFFAFIQRAFFQGSSATIYKQTFIDSVFHQQEVGRSPFAETAGIHNPTSDAKTNPLQILFDALTDASCFAGEFADSNKQQFFNAVFQPNEAGISTLLTALESDCISRFRPKQDGENHCPNVTLLLKALAQIDGSSAANRATCIEGVLHVAAYGRGSVLINAMRMPSALQKIVSLLKNSGCFTHDEYKQAFIDSLFVTNILGENALWSAGRYPKSLQITFECLKDAGCFDGPTGSLNQQAFVKAVFAKNTDGQCLIDSVSPYAAGVLLLKQLNKIHYFEGPFGESNKEELIHAVFKRCLYNNRSLLGRYCNSPVFVLLMEHLTSAGCFSEAENHPNKKAFIDAVFSQDSDGACVLSRIYYPGNLILLLEKLADSGCFNEASSCRKFIEAVRRNGNAAVFRSLNLKSYLVLYKYLEKAGCSKTDMKELLNESVERKYDYLTMATPLMAAMTAYNKDDILIARLIHDGATLTDIQKQQIADYEKKYKKSLKDKKDEASLDKANEIAKLRAPLEKSKHNHRGPLARRTSFSDDSLFFKKPAGNDGRAVDDIGVHLNRSARSSGVRALHLRALQISGDCDNIFKNKFFR